MKGGRTVPTTPTAFKVDMNKVPKANMDGFLKAMADELVRIKVEEPEHWARLCARADQIAAERAARSAN